jgi:hypothetical protein
LPCFSPLSFVGHFLIYRVGENEPKKAPRGAGRWRAAV